jgi:N utilization substance protein A
LKRLFELEVPEIYRGVVEIKSIAREGGYRSKVAVDARQEGVDAVGSCVGLRGIRIQNIVNELNGERIDVIQWDADSAKFVANSLSPAQVLSVATDDAENTASVIVPDRQLSLAIGKEGQNARLAAKLTGWRIDIKPETAMAEHLAAHPGATDMTAIQEETRKPAAAPASRDEAPEPWMEVVEEEEGEEAPAAAVAEGEAPTKPEPATAAASGLRFAEDLQPAMEPAATTAKKAKTKKKKERTPEEAAASAKKGSKKARRSFVVPDEEEDFAELLEEYGDWKDE